jgi:hypothetical protein
MYILLDSKVYDINSMVSVLQHLDFVSTKIFSSQAFKPGVNVHERKSFKMFSHDMGHGKCFMFQTSAYVTSVHCRYIIGVSPDPSNLPGGGLAEILRG